MSKVSNYWEEYSLWLEARGLHEEEAPVEDDAWIGYPDEWESGDMPEPPPNFVGEYWETND